MQDIATSLNGQVLAITTHDAIHIGTRRADGVALGQWSWSQLQSCTRSLALARDGLLVACATDGILWLDLHAARRRLELPS